MPNEISGGSTSFIVAAISKKRRMPDGGTDRMRSLRRAASRSASVWVVVSIGGVGVGWRR